MVKIIIVTLFQIEIEISSDTCRTNKLGFAKLKKIGRIKGINYKWVHTPGGISSPIQNCQNLLYLKSY